VTKSSQRREIYIRYLFGEKQLTDNELNFCQRRSETFALEFAIDAISSWLEIALYDDLAFHDQLFFFRMHARLG